MPHGIDVNRFCLVVAAGERRHFVNWYESRAGLFVAGIDAAPKTYAELIDDDDLHPERKFAGPDGRSCMTWARGLLGDLTLVVSGIRHVGKEGNDLDKHRAGLVS